MMKPQTKRDDLESLIYMLRFMYTGYLEWSGLDFIPDFDERNSKILQIKQKLWGNKLCIGMPPFIQNLIERVVKMKAG